MEELEKADVAHLDDRRDLLRAEGRVALVDDGAEVAVRDVRGEEADDFEGERLVVELREFAQTARDVGDGFGQEQPAVAGEAREDGVVINPRDPAV